MKINWKLIFIGAACLIIGAVAGYGIAVYAGNSVYSADLEITCPDNGVPDENGCCAGETYTDMGGYGFNCCPDGDGPCFPPIK